MTRGECRIFKGAYLLMFVGCLKEMGSGGVTTEKIFKRKVFSW